MADASPRRTLSADERAKLVRSMTFIVRAVAGAFVGVGLVVGVLVVLAAGLDRGSATLAVALVAAVSAPGAAIAGLLWLLGRRRRRALLDAPLRRGSGQIAGIRLPDPGGGGSTLLRLDLTLPDGQRRRGALRVHARGRDPFLVGEELTLWFADDLSAFLLDEVLGADPGTIDAP
ncbi:MAG: hypothetical protein H6711_25565 [Myxococcales bacterium]|nr:hypothetical protein [Myxococcales bacterium]